MTIACKLWLLAVVCVAFLYQDGPQGNGVLCRKKAPHSDEDNSSGAQSSGAQSSGAQTSGENDDDQNADNQSGDASGGNDSDGGGVGKGKDPSDDDDDDDDDDGDHDNISENKHTTKKNSGHGKNHHHNDKDGGENDDEEHVEDDEDDDEDAADTHHEKHKEHHKTCKKNKDDGAGEVQILMSTTITGKPKDIIKYVNKVKPYNPAPLDYKKKSESKLLKKIEAVTKRYKSSKGKKEPSEDLTSFMSDVLRASLKKKSSKQVDPDKVLITLVKSVLLQLLKDM